MTAYVVDQSAYGVRGRQNTVSAYVVDEIRSPRTWWAKYGVRVRGRQNTVFAYVVGKLWKAKYPYVVGKIRCPRTCPFWRSIVDKYFDVANSKEHMV